MLHIFMKAENSRLELYKWTCPICEYSRIQPKDDTNRGTTPLNTLRNHIEFTAYSGHGPEGRFPDDWQGAELATFIERL